MRLPRLMCTRRPGVRHLNFPDISVMYKYRFIISTQGHTSILGGSNG